MTRNDPAPADDENVDAAREHVRERIERLDDPFLGAAADDDDEF
jgi:hypothetical protein